MALQLITVSFDDLMTTKFKLANLTARFPFILFYQGDYTQSPTLNIINIVEKNFSSSVPKGQLKRFIYLIIEALQNIERYSAHVHSSEDFSFIFSDGDAFHIITQNTIQNSKIDDLTKRLEEITSKNQEELEDVYKTRLVDDIKTEKGAGLGLIEIARKSKNKLLYCFEKKTEDLSLYSLGISLSMNPSEELKPIDTFDVKKIITVLKSNFKANDSTLFYGGDISNTFIKSLFKLLEHAKTDKNSINKKTHHVLIELIQNIKKHSYQRSSSSILGQLFLEWKDKELTISTYNLAENIHTERIEESLAKLTTASHIKLKEYSKEQLSNLELIDGLGLIDISVLTYPEKISYTCLKKNELISELLLSTKMKYE